MSVNYTHTTSTSTDIWDDSISSTGTNISGWTLSPTGIFPTPQVVAYNPVQSIKRIDTPVHLSFLIDNPSVGFTGREDFELFVIKDKEIKQKEPGGLFCLEGRSYKTYTALNKEIIFGCYGNEILLVLGRNYTNQDLKALLSIISQYDPVSLTILLPKEGKHLKTVKAFSEHMQSMFDFAVIESQ